MPRDIPFLLNKYKTKDVNEIWTTEHELEYKRNQINKQRLYQLDCIVNEKVTKSRGTFSFPKAQKDRAKHLITNLDFYLGRTTEEQYIVMILIYIKLESNNKYTFNQFLPWLADYGIDVQTFVRFLVKLNKYHIEN